jgi:hypothetical protein
MTKSELTTLGTGENTSPNTKIDIMKYLNENWMFILAIIIFILFLLCAIKYLIFD